MFEENEDSDLTAEENISGLSFWINYRTARSLSFVHAGEPDSEGKAK